MSSDSVEIDFEVFADEFMALCERRWNEGAEEYGPTGFLKNDMIAFIAEELADISNYAMMTYMKVRALQEVAIASGIDLSASPLGKAGGQDEVPSDPSPFVPSEKVQQFLPNQGQDRE
jgi:hypothetical protein